MRRLSNVAVLSVLALAVGCSLFSTAVKTFEDMTPKERSLWMMSIYNKEYAEYEATVATRTPLPVEVQKVLRAKKAALVRAWPLIKAYNAMIQTGLLSEETEAAAFSAIETLLGIGGVNDG